MRWLTKVSHRFRSLFRRNAADRQLDSELCFHIERQIASNIAAGMSPHEARRQAMLEFGGVEQLKEECRDMRRINWLQDFAQDFRFGLRMLRKSPGFTAVAVLTLALGIGANTALFSVVNGVVLNPLPFSRSAQLVSIYASTSSLKYSVVSYPDFLDWQRLNKTFSEMAVNREQDYTLSGDSEPQLLHGQMVSWNFFSLLGVKPILGRQFRMEEDQIGAAPVALISDGLWRSQFASSSAVIGSSITLSDKSYVVVGVVPGRSPLYDPMDIFVPIGQWNFQGLRDRSKRIDFIGIGRLRSGVSIEQAQADMDSISRNLAATYPTADKDMGVILVPLKEDLIGDVTGILFVLFGAVGFVLLIACTNVASLFLVRAIGRAREFAVRAALGATRWRVIRQLLAETLILSLAGGALGLEFADWGRQAMLAALPAALPRKDEVHLDGHVLLFTLGISLLTGILFGLLPALRTTQPDLYEPLKEGGRSASATRRRTQRLFVVAETALAFVLLVGAGLMFRSLANLWGVNLGFDPDHVFTFSLSPPAADMANPSRIHSTIMTLTQRFQAVPGVEAAAPFAGFLPTRGYALAYFWVEGQPKPATTAGMDLAVRYHVTADYFKAMKIPLLRGRLISAEDGAGAPIVIEVDEHFAHQYFPGQDPIGKRVNFAVPADMQAEIVGVVGHVNHWGPGDTAHQDRQSELYLSLMQFPDSLATMVADTLQIVVRADVPPNSLVGPLRAAGAQFNRSTMLYDFASMRQIVSDSLAARRFSAILLGVFAALALLLAAIGIYGVISYLGVQRTHELGIRVALGAQPSDMLRMVLGQSIRLAVAGVGIGFVAALGLTRLLSKIIYGVSATDPLTYGAVAILLVLVALVACYIPARRAMRVDPMVALRHE